LEKYETVCQNARDVPLTATQIREAVLVSDCTNVQDAEEILQAAHGANEAERPRADLGTWGGRLVEIKRGRPQLMHQTVLEFVMGLDYKRIVFGDHLAEFISDNGRSFHFKSLASRKNWKVFGSLAVIRNLNL
jgi:hypothetical protein